MTDLTDLARHWLNQTAKGKGLRLDSDQLDLLNSLGIGEIIAAEAAKTLRAQCRTRTLRSIPGGNTASTPFLQIVWYDDASRRNRSRSTGTGEMRRAEEALDRLYLERERGQAVCPTCGKPMDAAAGHLLTQAIADYLVAKEDAASIDAIKPRLNHVLDFLEETGRFAISCDQVDEALITTFRAWSAKKPVIEGKHARKERERAPGTTEASVRSLAAAINYAHGRRETPFKAGFTALPPATVSRTPTFRADVKQLAAMFR